MCLDDLKLDMQRGAILLVPTQRAAQAWQARLFDPALHHSLPTVLPWGAWTAGLWQALLLHGREDRTLLNPAQNQELWTKVLRDADPGTLRPLHALVRLCTAAQHLVHGHSAAGRQLAFHGEPGTDTAFFADWFRTCTALCDGQRLLPPSALDGALAAHVRHGGPPASVADAAPAPLFLLGFDRLLPAQQLLLDELGRTGTSIRTLDAATLAGVSPGSAHGLRCSDAHQEWQALAHTLATTPPTQTVLVVLPDEAASHAALDRTLRSSLPATAAPRYEFAAGQPLATLPLASAALHLLRWTTGPLPGQAVAHLLQSPYLDLRVDRERAGELDADLLRDSRRLRPEWSITALAHRVTSREPELHEVLLRLDATASHLLRGEWLPGEWSVRLQELLHAAGWPGHRERNSLEYQLVDRWNELLEAVSSLDLFNRPVTFRSFLETLELTAAETLFAAENTGAPIQIVSPSEAAGSTADLLWFAHATEDTWNSRRTPSPLLPWSLQSECGMPGTDAARDHEEHRRVTARLVGSATTVVVSHAAMDGNGDLRPAAVFHDLPWLSAATLPDPLPAEPELDSFLDDTALPPLPDGIVHGGVGVLKDQAACAFRAFAERRLFSSEPDNPTLGFDPRQRGELLHYVLQLFWAEVETQGNLLHLRSSGNLKPTLQRHIDAALAIPASGDAWNATYLDLQRRRLLALLLQWFDLEAQRPPFRVLHTEHKVDNVPVGPLHFNLRVDRIDEVQRDGEPVLVLIDYKTGTPRTSDWTGPRPGDPQLPLYAVAANLENVGAIAFATVRPGDRYLGLRALPGTSELLFPNKSDSTPEVFDQQMEEWHSTMQRLGQDFARGDARVGPKQYPGTCTFCGQRMLCRLNPELLQHLATDDEAALEPAE